MKPFLTADCETDPFKYGRIPQPFLWDLFDGTKHKTFEKTVDFVNHVKNLDAIIYAHNGGKFDWFYVLPWLEQYDDIMLINGRISKTFLGLAELRDSYNLLPVPLSATSKTKIDYNIFEPGEREKPHNKKEILEYIWDDTEELYFLLEHFFSEFGRNLTLAGTALKTWEDMRGKKAPKTSASFYKTFQDFYYGGRVQCFESGCIRGDFVSIDINSAYPRAMMEQHPISPEYYHLGYDEINKTDIFGDMFLTVRCISKGALPLRTESKELVFPNDNEKRYYYITGWEYLAGIKTKTIIDCEIMEGFRFVALTNFVDYVTRFYRARKESKEKLKIETNQEKIKVLKRENVINKLLMNSLYGKFGANPENYTKNILVPLDDIDILLDDEYDYNLNSIVDNWAIGEKKLEPHEQRYYNVATAASITGYVRAELWKAICCSNRVLYCDTDSILCENPGENLCFSSNLGDWEIEGRYHSVFIAGKKLYALDGEKRKQASKGAKLTFEQIKKLAEGGIIIEKRESPIYSMKQGINFVEKVMYKQTDKENIDPKVKEIRKLLTKAGRLKKWESLRDVEYARIIKFVSLCPPI